MKKFNIIYIYMALGMNDALKSCSYTGIAYLITVALLIVPYLIFDSSRYMVALFAMIAVVISIIAGSIYHISAAKGEKFKLRFFEMLLISIGVALISFVVGIVAKYFLGVDLSSRFRVGFESASSPVG